VINEYLNNETRSELVLTSSSININDAILRITEWNRISKY